jgi:hypothetical protein
MTGEGMRATGACSLRRLEAIMGTLILVHRVIPSAAGDLLFIDEEKTGSSDNKTISLE